MDLSVGEVSLVKSLTDFFAFIENGNCCYPRQTKLPIRGNKCCLRKQFKTGVDRSLVPEVDEFGHLTLFPPKKKSGRWSSKRAFHPR